MRTTYKDLMRLNSPVVEEMQWWHDKMHQWSLQAKMIICEARTHAQKFARKFTQKHTHTKACARKRARMKARKHACTKARMKAQTNTCIHECRNKTCRDSSPQFIDGNAANRTRTRTTFLAPENGTYWPCPEGRIGPKSRVGSSIDSSYLCGPPRNSKLS